MKRLTSALAVGLVAAAGMGLPVGGATAAGLKSPVRGLVDRHGFPAASHTSAVRNWVVTVPWADLQLRPGGPIVRPNAIDNAVATARASGTALKLRIVAGVDAPAWAKTLNGPPVPMYDTQGAGTGGLVGTVPRFWTLRFDSAYRDLQKKLAARYDRVPEIRQTVITQCQTIFPEPYLRNAVDPRNVAGLLAAGFTRAMDDGCHNREIRNHAVWRRTRSELAMNPYQVINPDATTTTDEAYTESQIDLCRATLRARCVVANYSLSSTRPAEPSYGSLYAKMAAAGPPLAFQTATCAKIGDFQATLQLAVDMGASSVELPICYPDWPVDVLQGFAARLGANP